MERDRCVEYETLSLQFSLSEMDSENPEDQPLARLRLRLVDVPEDSDVLLPSLWPRDLPITRGPRNPISRSSSSLDERPADDPNPRELDVPFVSPSVSVSEMPLVIVSVTLTLPPIEFVCVSLSPQVSERELVSERCSDTLSLAIWVR
jgi:hypothetical protein